MENGTKEISKSHYANHYNYSKHDSHSLVPFRTMQIRTIRGPLYYLYFINVSHKQDVLLTLNGCGTFTYTTTYKAIHPPPTLSLPSSTYQFVKICLALAMVAQYTTFISEKLENHQNLKCFTIVNLSESIFMSETKS